MLLSGVTGGSKHFLRRGLQSLPSFAGTMVFPVEDGGLGVLPDAQPRPSHRRAAVKRGFDQGDCGNSSPLHQPGELAGRLDGTLVAGALFFVSAE